MNAAVDADGSILGDKEHHKYVICNFSDANRFRYSIW
jgi:hypothetical protein